MLIPYYVFLAAASVLIVDAATTSNITNNVGNGISGAFSECGEPKTTVVPSRPVKGNEAQLGEFPWAVAILYQNKPKKNEHPVNFYKCGGVLIHSGVVLTTAHCVIERRKYIVKMGAWDITANDELDTEVDSNVARIKVHPAFHPTTLVNNIALVYLKTPVDFDLEDHIGSACLPSQGEEAKNGTTCQLTGWGKVQLEGNYATTLKKLNIIILDRDECQFIYHSLTRANDFELHKSILCGNGKVHQDSCQGDDGSPLVCRTASGQYQVAALVSGIKGCQSVKPLYGDQRIPGMYTNVAAFRKWIDKQIFQYLHKIKPGHQKPNENLPLQPPDTKSKFGEVPWMAAVLYESNKKNKKPMNVYVCGGALLDSRVVVTAAHCVQSKKKYLVRVGEWDVVSKDEPYTEQDSYVEAIFIHPEYNDVQFTNNIAVLLLETPVKYEKHIAPIALPKEDADHVNRTCFLSGWGKNTLEGRHVTVLKKLQLSLVTRNECQSIYGKMSKLPDFKLDPSIMCAQGESGKDSCIGDDGSPLVCSMSDNPAQFEFVGVVSGIKGCESEDDTLYRQKLPGLYTNVSAFKKWIYDEIFNYRASKAYNNLMNAEQAENTRAKFGEVPWMAAVLHKLKKDGGKPKNVYLCGGALVHPSVVVTAAHCVEGNRKYLVRLGEWNVTSKEEPYKEQDILVKTVVTHPKYNKVQFINDVALLFLKAPARLEDHIRPISLLGEEESNTNATCFASGWGKTTFKGHFATVLKKINMKVVDRNLCSSQYGKLSNFSSFQLDSSIICGTGQVGVDSCIGDDGSPLVCSTPGRADTFLLAGLVSGVKGCESEDPRYSGEKLPGLYSNIAAFKDWMKEEIFQHTMKDCGNRNPNAVHSKRGETQAGVGELPWMAAVFQEKPKKVYKCGGALLHPRIVITAAHCIEKNSEYLVKLGQWNITEEFKKNMMQYHQVQTVVVHPGYDRASSVNNVALLILKNPTKYKENVEPICLPEQNASLGISVCFVSGWGKTAYNGNFSTVLKRMDMAVLKKQECERILRVANSRPEFQLDESILCAFGDVGKDSCTGDDGSPLVCNIPGRASKYQLVGLVSVFKGCEGDIPGNRGEQSPGLYTNVATFSEWIQQQITNYNL